MKLKYKLRIIFVVGLIVILNLGTIIVSDNEFNFESKTIYKIEQNYKFITVKEGDTIWSIVNENLEHIEKSNYVDLRDLVHQTIILNDGDELKIGQTIKIPL